MCAPLPGCFLHFQTKHQITIEFWKSHLLPTLHEWREKPGQTGIWIIWMSLSVADLQKQWPRGGVESWGTLNVPAVQVHPVPRYLSFFVFKVPNNKRSSSHSDSLNLTGRVWAPCCLWNSMSLSTRGHLRSRSHSSSSKKWSWCCSARPNSPLYWSHWPFSCLMIIMCQNKPWISCPRLDDIIQLHLPWLNLNTSVEILLSIRLKMN